MIARAKMMMMMMMIIIKCERTRIAMILILDCCEGNERKLINDCMYSVYIIRFYVNNIVSCKLQKCIVQLSWVIIV